MESARKHVQSDETIAKIKNFDESLKASQESIQALRSDFKSAVNSAQNTLINQAVISERPLLANNFTHLSGFQINTQNLTEMEVKTGICRPGWNQGFSNQIVMMAKNGIQQAKIKLNPIHLGSVEAIVKLTGEGIVVNLSALQLTTKDAMKNAISRLKKMLNENGFSQVDVNVSHQDKQEYQGAALGSNNEHGRPTMSGEEQLSDDELDLGSDAIAKNFMRQKVNIVDYYA